MSHKCAISGVSLQGGNRVSHANNKTHRVFLANLQWKRIFVPELKKTVRLKLSTRVIRTIDKLGFDATIRKFGRSLKQVMSQ